MSGIVDSELTEWELEALQKAEAKFMRKRGEHNAFSILPVVGEADIRGTWFTAYDNSLADERIAETYRYRPLLLHSEKNRFAYICDQFMHNWSQAPGEWIDCILRLEENPADEEAAQIAVSFGVDVAPDCYIISFPGVSVAPIFATRELLFRFAQFGLDCLGRLAAPRALPTVRLNDLITRWAAVVAAKGFRSGEDSQPGPGVISL